jgi:hypothetical protein
MSNICFLFTTLVILNLAFFLDISKWLYWGLVFSNTNTMPNTEHTKHQAPSTVSLMQTSCREFHYISFQSPTTPARPRSPSKHKSLIQYNDITSRPNPNTLASYHPPSPSSNTPLILQRRIPHPPPLAKHANENLGQPLLLQPHTTHVQPLETSFALHHERILVVDQTIADTTRAVVTLATAFCRGGCSGGG